MQNISKCHIINFMIKQIKEDLSRDLNCNPEDIQLLDEKREVNCRVRRVVYKDRGFKITTDVKDSAYLNIEPFHPNEQPAKKIVIDTTPRQNPVARIQNSNLMSKIKSQKPGTLFAGACLIIAIIYMMV